MGLGSPPPRTMMPYSVSMPNTFTIATRPTLPRLGPEQAAKHPLWPGLLLNGSATEADTLTAGRRNHSVSRNHLPAPGYRNVWHHQGLRAAGSLVHWRSGGSSWLRVALPSLAVLSGVPASAGSRRYWPAPRPGTEAFAIAGSVPCCLLAFSAALCLRRSWLRPWRGLTLPTMALAVGGPSSPVPHLLYLPAAACRVPSPVDQRRVPHCHPGGGGINPGPGHRLPHPIRLVSAGASALRPEVRARSPAWSRCRPMGVAPGTRQPHPALPSLSWPGVARTPALSTGIPAARTLPAGRPGLANITCDPSTSICTGNPTSGALDLFLISGDDGLTSSGPHLVPGSPWAGANQVSCSSAERCTYINTSAGSDRFSFYCSTNGGRTWASQPLPVPGGHQWLYLEQPLPHLVYCKWAMPGYGNDQVRARYLCPAGVSQSAVAGLRLPAAPLRKAGSCLR